MQERYDICFDEGQDLAGHSVLGKTETMASILRWEQVSMCARMVRRAVHGV